MKTPTRERPPVPVRITDRKVQNQVTETVLQQAGSLSWQWVMGWAGRLRQARPERHHAVAASVEILFPMVASADDEDQL